jgi:hypothetical protein
MEALMDIYPIWFFCDKKKELTLVIKDAVNREAVSSTCERALVIWVTVIRVAVVRPSEKRSADLKWICA